MGWIIFAVLAGLSATLFAAVLKRTQSAERLADRLDETIEAGEAAPERTPAAGLEPLPGWMQRIAAVGVKLAGNDKSREETAKLLGTSLKHANTAYTVFA